MLQNNIDMKKNHKNFCIFLNTNKVLICVLFFTFAMKLFLADWNSFWLDELYSVYRLMLLSEPTSANIDSVWELIHQYQTVRITSYPLYDVVLYIWMEIFGQSEVAVRALSILYNTLAIMFIYMFVKKIFGKHTAILSTLLLVFSFMTFHFIEKMFTAARFVLVTDSRIRKADGPNVNMVIGLRKNRKVTKAKESILRYNKEECLLKRLCKDMNEDPR